MPPKPPRRSRPHPRPPSTPQAVSGVPESTFRPAPTHPTGPAGDCGPAGDRRRHLYDRRFARLSAPGSGTLADRQDDGRGGRRTPTIQRIPGVLPARDTRRSDMRPSPRTRDPDGPSCRRADHPVPRHLAVAQLPPRAGCPSGCGSGPGAAPGPGPPRLRRSAGGLFRQSAHTVGEKPYVPTGHRPGSTAHGSQDRRRFSLRQTNFSPDQSSPSAATFTSTMPKGRNRPRRARSVMSLS